MGRRRLRLFRRRGVLPAGSFGTSYAARTGRTGAAKRAAPEKPKTVLSAPKAPDFKKGDRVVHKAFGKGVNRKDDADGR